MRDLIFTVYRCAQDTQGKPITQSWDKWKALFSHHEVRGSPEDTASKAALDKAKNGPAVVFGTIPLGSPRRTATVTSVDALAVDIDGHDEPTVLEILTRLRPYEYFVWTTHKHGSEIAGGCPRLRVVLPLAEPLKPQDYAAAWNRLNSFIDHINDSSTKDICRLHFLPSTFDLSVAQTHHNAGTWLSIDALPEPIVPVTPVTPVPAPKDDLLDDFLQREALRRIRHLMRSIHSMDELKPMMRALSSGTAFAEEGQRHNAILRLTMWLAFQDPSLSHDAIRAIFAPSITTMTQISPSCPTIDACIRAYDGAVEKVEPYKQQQKQQQQKKTQMQQNAKGTYTDDELQHIATVNGWSVDELHDRWIIQRDGSIWVLMADGTYAGPYGDKDSAVAIAKYLSRAPIRIIEPTRSGYRRRSVSDIVCEHGTLADSVISDMTIQRTTFDPQTCTIREAIRPLRKDLEPHFDPEIDHWLKLMAGPSYKKLIDWMSKASDLNELLCAIYFDGAPSSGKTLFAYGMSKMWTDGPPADIELALSDFNDEIVRCPLIVADEEIPKSWRRTVTATLRSMLSTTSRTLKRKYRPTSEVRGAVRLILTANNEFLLDSKEVATSQDLEAIAQRFLYIKVSKESTDFLNSLSAEKTREWITTGIARHALWLAEHHTIENPARRFVVEGDVTQMHRRLMTGTGWNSLCCEWLVRYLMDPRAFDSAHPGLIRKEDGELLVNDQALIDGWGLYLKTKTEPETAKIGAALRAISRDMPRRQLRHNGIRIRYRVIDVQNLLHWSDRYGIGDEEVIMSRLTRQQGEELSNE